MSVGRTWQADPGGRATAESQESYRPGWEPVIDLECTVTSAESAWPGVGFCLMSHDESASSHPAVSVEFDGVEARVPCFFGRGRDGSVVDVRSRR